MTLRMTIYMKLYQTDTEKNRKSEWFDIIKETEPIFINLPTKKTPQIASLVNYSRI